MLRPILKTLQPRLAASLDREPERAVAILVWAWARLPEVIGDAVDLSNAELVAAIVERVEQREGLRPPADDPTSRSEPTSAPS